MTVAIIAAMSSNRVIGLNGNLPWHIPEDLRHFRELTTGHTLIMGRKTFESIGRALPFRRIIIISRQAGFSADGCLTATSFTAALRLAEPADEVFICGGGEIYRQALPYAAKLYLTVIDEQLDGDTTFPEIPNDEFTLIASEKLAVTPKAVLNVYLRITAQSQ